MSALLIITVGHTDVQLVQDGVRRELDRNAAGQIHAALAARVDWTLVDSEVRKAERGSGASALPPGPFQLCTPKLDAVLAFAQEHGTPLSHALILHTTRAPRVGGPAPAGGDPSQAGAVVQQRLREKTGVQGVLSSYLGGQERLEDRDDPRDAVLRRAVVQRLEQAILTALQAEASPILLATTGGIPEVSALVRELVQLHAAQRPVLELDIPDASKSSNDGLDRAQVRPSRRDPSAVVAAKRHALDLVEKGNFIAAWGAVAHLANDEDCRPWINVLRWLYQWAASLPIDRDCDLSLPATSQRAAHAAIRVELALRCEDIPRAVHATVAFFEAAVWDHLYERHAVESTVSRTGRPRYRLCPEPPPAMREMKKKEMDGGVNQYEIDAFGERAVTICRDYLHRHCPARTVSLSRLSERIVPALRRRNMVAHGEPRRENLEEARQQMKDDHFWSASERFLEQPEVCDVLRELGVNDPASLCESLIDEVGARLRAVRP
ncbi:MAG TPA: hypothetical protein PKU97_00245 [Kofleriaceae bacterium]|nr:hypothetical protein [Kofleriaceae bacterium]